jgi:outer membrane protein insertion porin family
MKKSAGMGLRVFLPMFGLLGFDFGYGFDKPLNQTDNTPSGWHFHIYIGQSIF